MAKSYKRFQNIYNELLSEGVPEAMIKFNAINYFELLEHNFRGIPDGMIGHALERYISYFELTKKFKY